LDFIAAVRFFAFRSSGQLRIRSLSQNSLLHLEQVRGGILEMEIH
jgi:hypothetical protein